MKKSAFMAAFSALIGLPWGHAAQAFSHLQRPAAVRFVTQDATLDLTTTDGLHFNRDAVQVSLTAGDSPRVSLSAPFAAVKQVIIRWDAQLNPNAKYLPDAWERAYGDLQWSALDAKRPMPWYFLASDGAHTDGYGVMTAPHAMCCWYADEHSITLVADVRSGGVGVKLGDRTLEVCTIVSRQGSDNETPFAAGRAFCRQMCPHPRISPQPLYGFNDWYCSYGNDSAKNFLDAARMIAQLAPDAENRPFCVVDDGWDASAQGEKSASDPWEHSNSRFGMPMPQLASEIRSMNAKPGVWYRPLLAWPDAPQSWRLPGRPEALDPSVPQVREQIARDVKRFLDWGFVLIKHDFTTNDITGLWGPQMGAAVAPDGWSFADPTHTTAEIVLQLYQTIREAAGDQTIIDGCNTFSHLSAGLFDLQRIGDDTSGTDWSRTVKMGVNALTFRAIQHGTFYAVDADCAGLAKASAIPWEKNRQWLDLLADGGVPLFVSFRPDLTSDAERADIKRALAAAAKPAPVAKPLDWLQNPFATKWRLGSQTVSFTW